MNKYKTNDNSDTVAQSLMASRLLQTLHCLILSCIFPSKLNCTHTNEAQKPLILHLAIVS